MKTIIREEDLVYFSKRRLDRLGCNALYNGRILRIIPNEKRPQIECFLGSKCYQELIRNSLIVSSHFCDDLYLDDKTFILESPYIENSPQPYEWSFSMLRDATLLTIDILNICIKHGYSLVDGHPYNIVFSYTKPLWCDIGSIVEMKHGDYSALNEIVRTMYWPLKLWAKGNDYLAYLILHDAYYDHLLFNQSAIPRFSIVSFSSFFYRAIEKIYFFLLKKNLSKFSLIYLGILKRKIQKLKPWRKSTSWCDYQNKFLENEDNMRRITAIKDFIVKYCHDVQTVVDLAGNQGEMSKYLIRNNIASSAVSTDYDGNAIDLLYLSAQKDNLRITPFLRNFMDEIPQKAIMADLVLAMAVTHHLILTQQIPVDMIFQEIKRCTRRYVIIEFMPLGLWDGKTAKPVPCWYTQQWFTAKFEKFFHLLHVEKIETNRIVFIGEIKKI